MRPAGLPKRAPRGAGECWRSRTAGAGWLQAGFPRLRRWLRCKGNFPQIFTSAERKAGSRSLHLFPPRPSHSLPAQKTECGFVRLAPERVPTRNFLRERRAGGGWRRGKLRAEKLALWGWARRRGPQPGPRPCAAPGAWQVAPKDWRNPHRPPQHRTPGPSLKGKELGRWGGGERERERGERTNTLVNSPPGMQRAFSGLVSQPWKNLLRNPQMTGCNFLCANLQSHPPSLRRLFCHIYCC